MPKISVLGGFTTEVDECLGNSSLKFTEATSVEEMPNSSIVPKTGKSSKRQKKDSIADSVEESTE